MPGNLYLQSCHLHITHVAGPFCHSKIFYFPAVRCAGFSFIAVGQPALAEKFSCRCNRLYFLLRFEWHYLKKKKFASFIVVKFVFCVWYKTGSCLAGSQLDGQLCRMRSLSSSPFSCGAEIPSLMNTKVILKWALFGDFFFFFWKCQLLNFLTNLKRRTVLPPPSATSKGGQGV